MTISEKKLIEHIEKVIADAHTKAKSIDTLVHKNYMVSRSNTLQKLKMDILAGAFEEDEDSTSEFEKD